MLNNRVTRFYQKPCEVADTGTKYCTLHSLDAYNAELAAFEMRMLGWKPWEKRNA